MDPSAESKANHGLLVNNLTRFTKWLDRRHPRYVGDKRYCHGSVAIGMKPEELEKSLSSVYKTFSDPVFVSRDGSMFDSHQHWYAINSVDNVMLKTVTPILARLGYTNS